MPWRGPNYPGEIPTLGWQVLDWMSEYLVVPFGPQRGSPLILTREQAQFVVDLYALDPNFEPPVIRGNSLINARRVRRGILSRPKGWGKSPLLAALAIVEGLGDVILDGWDADGEPVGRPWATLGFKAKVQILAVSEGQTENTWEPVLEMCQNGPVLDAFDIEPLQSWVNLPFGRIEYQTSEATSREGGRPIFGVFDQTESWTKTNGGVKLAATMRRNLTKNTGASVETPNAFVPGEDSVAEKSFEAYALQENKKLRADDGGILLNHREAPPETDPEDKDSLLAGFAVAYGDSADINGGWVNLRRVLQDYWDPDTDPYDARRYFLNQVVSASDSWLISVEWGERYNPDRVVADREMITLGFDGSKKRTRGVTDATALIGCCVDDGHLFEVATWEQPDGPAGKDWEVPRPEVQAAVRSAMQRYKVVGFFADPAKWESEVAGWEALYGRRMLVKATGQHPIEWWMTGGRATQIVKATDALATNIRDRKTTHDGSFTLTRHMLNAKRKVTPQGIMITKEHPESRRKIDAAVAAILANWARTQALAAGLANKRKTTRRATGF
jgi:hypothetical protein